MARPLEDGDGDVGVEAVQPGSRRHSSGHTTDDDHALGPAIKGNAHRENQDFRLTVATAASRHRHRSSFGTSPSTCST